MALQGTLETFALPDVLRLLASTKKTGAYRLDGNRGSGCLWVSEGKIIGGDVAGSPTTDPIEVAFELLRFTDGDFVFDADAECADPGDPVEVEHILGEAEKLLEEWKEIEAVVPSLNHGLALQPDLPGEEVTIRADIWIYVVAIGAGTTVGRLGSRLGLGELGISKAVKTMIELGLVELSEPGAAAPVPEPEPEPEPADEPEPEADTDSIFEAAADEEPAEKVSFADSPSFMDEPVAVAPKLAPDVTEEEEEPAAFAPFDPNALLIEDSELVLEPVEGLDDEYEDEELVEIEPEPFLAAAPEPTESDPTDAAEIARQLANLSPKAAKAVAAAAKATTQEEREAALAEVDDSEDPINRELLLKFLGSVSS